MTLDKQAVERVARAIFDSHNETYTVGGPTKWGADPDHWRRYAQAAIAALVPQEEEVGRMVERLRDAKPLGPGNVGVSGKTANDAADLFERLVGIQGK